MSRKKAPTPLLIKFGGDYPQTVEFDPKKKQAFALSGIPGQVLVVAWDVDQSGYGYWRIKLIGVEGGQIEMKEFTPGAKHAAFFGGVSVVGAGQNELHASFSYEDDDIKDPDGNITNKVKEVRIYPVRED